MTVPSVWQQLVSEMTSVNAQFFPHFKRHLLKLYNVLVGFACSTLIGLDRLDSRRDVITQKMFQEIKDQKHPLHYLLPPIKVSNSQIVLRPTDPY